MVGKLFIILILATLLAVHAQNLQKENSTSIKPYTLAKLHDPKNEGIGFCKASAKGFLKGFGEIDTSCNVHWSDKKKEVTGK